MAKERCANCDREIRPLETPYLYRDNVVCYECYSKIAPVVYVDRHKKLRFTMLIMGIFIWPLLLVWVGLGIYHNMQQAKVKEENERKSKGVPV
jgi:predicted nucleic acid-binding Zn ribbon protein